MNNAVESIVSDQGIINMSLFEEDQNVVIQITDNGKGISADLIAKLGKLGVTYGKLNGHGLGLFHAKNTIESWSIQTDPGKHYAGRPTKRSAECRRQD